MGPTRVWYLIGGGEIIAEVGPMEGMPSATAAAGDGTVAAAIAATATATRAIGATTAAAGAVEAGPGLELPAGEGEDYCTLGRKLCPPRIFTMVGLEKEKSGEEGRRGDFKSDLE